MEPGSQPPRGFPVAFLLGLIVVGVVLGGFYFYTQRTASHGPSAPKALPMGPAEEAYASKIHFLDIKMSRAANLLNQEVTYVTAILSNDGDRSIRDLEVTVEFRDVLNQVVLRDDQEVIKERSAALLAGETRAFRLLFDRIPDSWNRQVPQFQLLSLELQ